VSVRLSNIGKRYGATRALNGVDLTLTGGRVHALVGENGAGKSTCLGIIGGRTVPSTGEIELDGERVTFASPAHAASNGVVSIYQELSVIPSMSVLHNVFLGSEPRRTRWTDDSAAMRTAYAQVASRIGADIDPDVEVGSLSVGDQQMVEIMRALSRRPRVMLMDEPTAALGPRERQALYGVIAGLRDEGVVVAFVSHNLEEVLGVSDDISVFRDGELCGSGPSDQWSRDSLMSAMIGHPPQVDLRGTSASPKPRKELLRVDGLSGGRVEDVSLDVRAGEIVGIAGLVGSGRSTLLRLIAGAQRPTTGRWQLDGVKQPWPSSVRSARRQGIVYLTEDRKAQGILPESTTAENIVLGRLGPVARRGIVTRRSVRDHADVAGRQVGFATTRLSTNIGALSGGNQQKALLARVLHAKPRLILADEPTRGVDVGAKDEISRALRDIADRGGSVMMVSSEYEELAENCDRVLVMWHGTVVAELRGPDIGVDTMVKLSFGTEGLT
jgi:ABC-type sugar transport system ATPase subunit